jgi:hypothetical protein
MTTRKSLGLTAFTTFAVVLTTAVALASGSDQATSDPQNGSTGVQTVATTSSDIIRAFPTLSSAPQSSAAMTAEQVMRDALASTSDADHGPIGSADFSDAVSSAIDGSSGLAWLVPSGDQACLVLPDPVDGYGAACSSLTDVAAGRGYLVLGPGLGSDGDTATIAVLVPQGGDQPQIENADGSRRSLSVDGNVAAAVVRIDTGASLRVGATSIPLKSFLPPR